MHQKHWTFEQETPATTWNVNNVPSGAKGAVITHIVTDGGQVLQPDNQLVSPDGLQLSFGVEAVTGTAYGDYYDDNEITINGNGSTMNITINQNSGGKAQEPHNFPESEGGND